MLIAGIAFGISAFVMLTVGLCQYRSQVPVGFYSAQEPPKAHDLTDVKAWNRRHGLMWILYGALLPTVWSAGFFLQNTLVLSVLWGAGILLPLPFMILYHHRLLGRYLKKTAP